MTAVLTQDSRLPLSAEAERAVAAVFERDCGRGAESRALAAQLVGLLLDKGFDSGEVKSWLAATGIGHAWNQALDQGRPRSVAPRVLPLFTGRVADVLSGSGTLTAELATEAEIDAYERPSAYPQDPAVDTRPLDDFWSAPAGRYQTVLFSTVLHHEPDPRELVELVLRTHRPDRLVVIENCIDEHVSSEFHDFMDVFFNVSLNDFAVDCPGEHRTVREWLDFLGRYGAATFVERLDAVTGMPFPYEIFVVDVEPEACR